MSDPQNPAFAREAEDIDREETAEWLESLASVIQNEGPERARYLMKRLADMGRQEGIELPFSTRTAYINTIPPHLEQHSPGDMALEARLRGLMRWNAMAMVVRANKENDGLGGHIASFTSVATMFGTGFHHFWRAPSATHGGDLVYFQGHSSPGIYARAFLEGRLSEEQLVNFRREAGGNGLSSYPHPRLMPGFWQFPTVSMGLGPMMALYQARFMKYLDARGIADMADRKVWVFCGDGEMDEPEAMGAISMASREKLDNLIMVINCNLQRLDGPVRGNGKIIQELESDFRGAGWNVIKVIWGSDWDALLEGDHDNALKAVMMDTVDGEYQNYAAQRDGAYVREHFFGKDPRALQMVASLSDDQIYRLSRGGHDPQKVYAAFKAAFEHKGQPTVILCKTVKGYGMGAAAEALNIAHQVKKLDDNTIRQLRDRAGVPIPDEELHNVPFYRPAEDAPEMVYLREKREALGGFLPVRRLKADERLPVPPLSAFQQVLEPSAAGRETSTTQAYVRMINLLLRDTALGQRIVPIMVDESRTFGMEGLFRQIGIFSQQGQLYEPVDIEQVMYYREDKTGQILQEGINEAGGTSSWIAAATAYSNHNRIMIPFYTFYSMFGFQRTGDLIWAAADSMARGFLIGGTAGRTTLNGEGLQHEDGHSHIMAATIPSCMPYDPAFAHEVAVIIHDGITRMVERQEDVFYYITVMNESYPHPGLQPGQEEGILKGMYLLQKEPETTRHRVQLLGSGTILREAIAAAELLKNDWNIAADIWSVTSFTLASREGQEAGRWNRMHPDETPRIPYVTQCLQDTAGPIIASTDYVRAFAEQIRAYIPEKRRYTVLGTDGFGLSDTRAGLRHFFEIDRYYITLSALQSLSLDGVISGSAVAAAIRKYAIDVNKPDPVKR
ncbi:pyruvate dehydrogenase (acetyl-transferring), homodimeric type [Oxalobacter sp. OttesenSCG-928-P03]|nr:pyruvate dehydrogenase (acetyl-transferring), homodimeric type [Oxalobacter sp. OttesenSCG-928-P03]